MKKWLSIAVLTFAILGLTIPAYAADVLEVNDSVQTVDNTAEYATVVYGEKTVTCKNAVIKYGDFTFLPLHEVLEAYGASMIWAEDEAETKVVITVGQDHCQLVMDLDKQIAYGLDGREYSLHYKDNILYFPVHFFVQMVNCEFAWDKELCMLTLYPDKVKTEALKTDDNGVSTTCRWIMNLPTYEKTFGSVYETGAASYYGGKFHGRKTASGERFDKNALTAAHKTLPFGTIVRVTADWNQQYVDVRINDRGPFTKGRIIDLSTAAASQLGMLSKGVGNVSLKIVAWPE